MKMLKQWIERIPRPVRAIFYTVLALVLSISYYFAVDCPTLSIRQDFRRAEKVHMVGPSTIVDTLSKAQYDDFDKLLVAETDYGICFFGRFYLDSPNINPFKEKQYCFSYLEKTGDLTICAAPNLTGAIWANLEFTEKLPVYLFTEYAEAVRAEMDLTITGSFAVSDIVHFTASFQLEAQRADKGFFRFMLESDTAENLAAMYYFSEATGGNVYISQNIDQRLHHITAVIRLYDAAGTMILEKTVTIVENLDAH